MKNQMVILLLLLSLSTRAEENLARADLPMLNLSIGNLDIATDITGPYRFGVEYRFRSFSQWKIIPAVGYAFSSSHASFLYTDLRHDFWLSDRWILIPSFGVGYFDDSTKTQLGYPIEFRSGIELAYRFYRQYRIGMAVFHLSNGDLSKNNPGTEVLVASLTIPVGKSH